MTKRGQGLSEQEVRELLKPHQHGVQRCKDPYFDWPRRTLERPARPTTANLPPGRPNTAAGSPLPIGGGNGGRGVPHTQAATRGPEHVETSGPRPENEQASTAHRAASQPWTPLDPPEYYP